MNLPNLLIMSVKERIKFYVKSINLPVTSFEKSIGASNGYVNGIFKSIGVDKRDLIIEKYPDLNIDWLLTGRGKMLLNDSEETTMPGSSDSIKDKYISLLELTISNLEFKIKGLEVKIKELGSESKSIF